MDDLTEPFHRSTFTPSAVDVAWLLAATRDRNPIHVWRMGSAPPIAQGFFGIGKAYIAAAELLGVNAVVGVSADFRRAHLVDTPADLLIVRSDSTLDGFDRLQFAIDVDGAGVASSGYMVVNGPPPRVTQ